MPGQVDPPQYYWVKAEELENLKLLVDQLDEKLKQVLKLLNRENPAPEGLPAHPYATPKVVL